MSSVFVFAGTESPEPPDVDSKEEASMKDVKPVLACRACLAVERPLRPMTDYLADSLASLVGSLVQDESFEELFPKYICSFCHAVLVKFNTFKDKCQSVQVTLQHISFQDIPITLDNIKLLADESPYPDFKTATFVHAMPDDYHPRCTTTRKDSTIYNEVQCKSENDKIFTERVDDVEYDDTQNDMILTVGNDNNHSDYNDSSDDGGFLINLVGSNREIDKKDSKNKFKSRKVKYEHSESKMKSEKKTKIKRKLVKSVTNENGETIKRTKNKKIKQKLRVKTDKSQIEIKYDVTIVPLSLTEQIKQIEARKDSLNYKGAIFKCDLCYHGFNVEATFRNHMAKHDPSRGDNECEICHLRYPDQCNLNHHRSIAHTIDYVCNSCGAISKSTTAAKHHMNWHKGVKYDCKICGKKFNKPNSVQGHMHWSHGGNVQCAICNQMCLGQQGLRQHMAKMHKKYRACAECGKGFLSEQLLHDHKQQHHFNELFCVKCGTYFSDREKYLKHMTAHAKPRGNRLGDIGSKRGVGCRNPSTGGKGTLERPLKILPMVNTSTDAGVKSYICEICGCHKISKQTLRNHLMTHTGEKPYQCDYCDRRFIVKAALRAHIHSHMVKSGHADKAPLKEYYCRICNMMFNYQNNRRRHEKTVHQQVRRYTCQMCGSTYKFSESLKQHINTKHLGMSWPKRNRRATRAQGAGAGAARGP